MTETDLFASINFVGRFLQICGHWPLQKPKFFQELKSFYCLITAIIFVGINSADIVLHFSNFMILAENMSVTTPVLAYAMKLIIFKTQKSNFFQMVERLGTSSSFKRHPELCDLYVKPMSRKCILVTQLYGGLCVMVVILYAVLALLSEAVLPIKLSFNLGKWLYPMFLFQMSTIMNTASNTVSLDMLTICCMGCVISQLEILKEEIEKFVGEQDENEQDKKTRFNHCVIHHIEIMQFLGTVEKTFSLIFLTQYLASIFTICNIGFQLAHVQPFSAEFTKTILYFSAMMLQLSVYCWFGNEIVIKSVEIGDACYKTNWLLCDDRLKKSLIILMIRASRPLAVTAGKFSQLSLRSFTSIMNASYSYFTLMQRLYKDDEN